MKRSPWITHSSEYSFENPYFKVKTSQVTTPGGQPGSYGVLEIKPAVVIVAFNAKQEFCLIHEFRYAQNEWIWELPIGGTEAKDSDYLIAAQRELQEETGLTSDDWEYIGKTRNFVGLSNHISHIYVAYKVSTGQSHIEHDEAIDAQRFVSIPKFFEEVSQGIIDHSESIGIVAIVAAHLKISHYDS